ncbi:hypothetical protein HanHA300_Chr16g0620401 [Helianthus annuus]|nr:hypothetical protein HanHA300_Chr16g0620401 [Helianthus annuus]KAJ0461360.1 hypothetical protein HanHA89_Chr16g0671351 [Helianthus annuus]KAJ0641786.1 hypothetical protein HanLR1_Chr16g0631031 [Helianthus annuus]
MRLVSYRFEYVTSGRTRLDMLHRVPVRSWQFNMFCMVMNYLLVVAIYMSACHVFMCSPSHEEPSMENNTSHEEPSGRLHATKN